MREIALAVVALLVAAILAAFFFLTPEPRKTAATQATIAPALPAPNVQAFFDGIDHNDLDAVKGTLAKYPKLISQRAIQAGELPLHHARSREMAMLLLDAGADPAALDRDHKARAVRWAASDWLSDVVAALETRAGGDEDVFYFAASGKVDKLSQALLARPELLDARTDGTDVLGGSRHLLHIAATYGQTSVADALIKAGADPNVGGGWGDSQPLENAAWAGYTDVVKLLIAHGADLDAQDSGGHHTALWYAAVTGRKQIVEALLNAGAKIEDGMVQAVRDATHRPYPGRDLPKREDYEAVIVMLQEHGGK